MYNGGGALGWDGAQSQCPTPLSADRSPEEHLFTRGFIVVLVNLVDLVHRVEDRLVQLLPLWLILQKIQGVD